MNSRKPFCYAHLYGNIGMTKTYFGKKILINTQNIYTLSIIDNGYIEKAICKILEDNLLPGNVFVDIGANIGFLTLLGCHLTGNNGYVYAFEANPEVYKTLEENIMINGYKKKTILYNKAVHSENTRLQFTWNTHRDGSGRIVTEVQSGLAQNHCEIDAIALDSILSGKKIDFIKIDVEGSEPYVLDGMKKIIQSNKDMKVILEWNTKHMKQRAASPENTADFLFAHFKHIKKIVKVDEFRTLTRESLLELPHSNIFAHN
jgi:FkbM family methyltransferase